MLSSANRESPKIAHSLLRCPHSSGNTPPRLDHGFFGLHYARDDLEDAILTCLVRSIRFRRFSFRSPTTHPTSSLGRNRTTSPEVMCTKIVRSSRGIVTERRSFIDS